MNHDTRKRTLLPLLLVLMAALSPLAIDMYLPAVPGMADIFETSESIVSLTIMLFFLFFALSILISGALSDKVGRKATALTGLALYTAGAAGCIFSTSITFLIIARILQAVGAGMPFAVATAVVQDIYTGRVKKRMFSIVTSMMLIAPAVAPLIGSFILSFAGWKTIFAVLAGIGAVTFTGALFFSESLPEKRELSVLQSAGRIFTLLKSGSLRRNLILYSLLACISLGFIGASSLIYINGFGVSSTRFSLYFSLNAALSIAGALLYPPLSRLLKERTLSLIFFTAIAAGGVLILSTGGRGPGIFILCVLPATFSAALLRPQGMHIMMEQGSGDIGAASSLVNFLFAVFGSVSMQVLALSWRDRISVFGIVTVVTGLTSLLLYIGGRKKSKPELPGS